MVIGGPTASGKTGLSLALAERFEAEIVSADSMQVYRHMDVGTAKPTPAERARAPHHLIDVADPDEHFDAAEYLTLARPLIENLDRQGRRVIVVGGTGLYLRSLLQGLFPGPKQDAALRERLKAEANAAGSEALHAGLGQVDREAAARIHPRDLVRIVRALEVFELTGRPISEFQKEHDLGERPYRTLFFCLNPPREELYETIEFRTREMFEQGLIEEVERLLKMGYSPDLKPMQAIGYKETIRHLRGRLSFEEAIAETAKNTRRYAKRQLTWYRAQPDIVWIAPTEADRAAEAAADFWRV